MESPHDVHDIEPILDAASQEGPTGLLNDFRYDGCRSVSSRGSIARRYLVLLSRSRYRFTLPVAVSGNSSTNSTHRGYLNGASLVLTWS